MKRALALIVLMLGVAGVAFGQSSSGPNSPASASDDSNGTNGAGGTAWATQSSGEVVDGTGATCAMAGTSGTATDLLVLNGFGFSIPAGSTILGVSVTVTLKGSNSLIDQAVWLCSATGTVLGTNQKRSGASTWTTSYNAVTYGGSSSTWGASLTSAIVNGAGFGFEIGTAVLGSPGGTQTANVDGATMTVTYTPPPVGGHRIFEMEARSIGFQRDVRAVQTAR